MKRTRAVQFSGLGIHNTHSFQRSFHFCKRLNWLSHITFVHGWWAVVVYYVWVVGCGFMQYGHSQPTIYLVIKVNLKFKSFAFVMHSFQSTILVKISLVYPITLIVILISELLLEFHSKFMQMHFLLIKLLKAKLWMTS